MKIIILSYIIIIKVCLSVKIEDFSLLEGSLGEEFEMIDKMSLDKIDDLLVNIQSHFTLHSKSLFSTKDQIYEMLLRIILARLDRDMESKGNSLINLSRSFDIKIEEIKIVEKEIKLLSLEPDFKFNETVDYDAALQNKLNQTVTLMEHLESNIRVIRKNSKKSLDELAEKIFSKTKIQKEIKINKLTSLINQIIGEYDLKEKESLRIRNYFLSRVKSFLSIKEDKIILILKDYLNKYVNKT